MRASPAVASLLAFSSALNGFSGALAGSDEWTEADGVRFFENHVRPLLVARCYECHSEEAGEQQGGLLLDRESGWINGGTTNAAVVPGNLEESLLIESVRYQNEDLQMPPDEPLDPAEVRLLEEWIRRGAPSPKQDESTPTVARLGDQEHLFGKAQTHWAFGPVKAVDPPDVKDAAWSRSPVDRFVYARLAAGGLTPSPLADPRTLRRRLTYDLTGLPPTAANVQAFGDKIRDDRQPTLDETVDTLLNSPAFGEHFARMWLDVARYADTDSSYRPDTKTPRYLPFAFTYRDYVIRAFNEDTPYDQFVRQQLAADLMEYPEGAPEFAALGFLSTGPHLRQADNSIDDWIDVTSRGLLGLTAACARCHDHKFEPIPTADYYSLFGVFASITRSDPLDETKLAVVPGYAASDEQRADYSTKRAKIDADVEAAGSSVAKNNNRSIAEKIRETALAELLTFHEGGPALAMVVTEKNRPFAPYVFQRGERTRRGDSVPRRFLRVLDPEQQAFPEDVSGRLELAEAIVDPANPLAARVFVNRVWGYLTGDYLVDTPSDFGLQGAPPSHPGLLDWLAHDFVSHGWSVKHLVRRIVSSRTYQQQSRHRPEMAELDPENQLYWRANRKRLTVEALRDTLLSVSGQLEVRQYGRPGRLWGEDYTRRRSLYGFIDRFNLDPTLRSFDFPSAMQTAGRRDESIVAAQALFTMNAPIVIEQSAALLENPDVAEAETDEAKVGALFLRIFQRSPHPNEQRRIVGFVEQQRRLADAPNPPNRPSPWSMAAQALIMSNEFQYVD